MPESRLDEEAEQRMSGGGPDSPVVQESKRLALIKNPAERDQAIGISAKNLKVSKAALTQSVNGYLLDQPIKGVVGSELAIENYEPWPAPVSGDELLSEIVAQIHKYLHINEHAANAVALWILYSYVFDEFFNSPILYITSPEKRCGKTLLLNLISRIANRPLSVSNCTTATLYRAIEKFRPTMLVDEADSFLGESNELRGIINSGFTKGGGVIRTTGDDYEPRIFSTYAPKAIAGIKTPPDTIVDRSIMIHMERKTKTESVKRFRKVSLPEIQQKCQRWAVDNQPGEIEPVLPESLGDREQDAWEPLFAVAALAGGGWPEIAKQAALNLCSADSDDSIERMLLADIRDAFEGKDRIKSADLVDALNRLEDRPWPTWARGNGLTANTLSRKLKPYGIKPATHRFDDGIAKKGYKLSQFESTFARYLPPSRSQSVTPLQPNNAEACGDFQSVPEEASVTDEKYLKPAPDQESYGVTDNKGDEGRERLTI